MTYDYRTFSFGDLYEQLNSVTEWLNEQSSCFKLISLKILDGCIVVIYEK